MNLQEEITWSWKSRKGVIMRNEKQIFKILVVFLFITLNASPALAVVESYTLDSPHPYPNNYDNTWTITKTGATKVRVHFENIEIESGYDRLYVKDKDDSVLWESETVYGGKKTYTDLWSPWANGNTIKIQLKTDPTVTYWGFKIDKIEYETAVQNDAWDPTDDSASSGTSITPMTATQQHGPHSLSSTDKYDWFRISMTAGRAYYFYGSWNSYSDTYAELYSDSSGSNRVAYDDDAGGSGQFSFSYTATNTQTYYLRIRSYTVGTDSNYYLNYYYKVQQNDAGSGGDAGDTFDVALSISPGSYSGYVDSSDRNDYYKFYVSAGQRINVSVTPPSSTDFDLYLYNPSNIQKASSRKSTGYVDSIAYTADSSGYWRFNVYQFSGSGTYSFSLNIFTPPDPSISITAPGEVNPGETFAATVSLTNNGGDSYFAGGAHLRIDAGDLASVSQGNFDSYATGISDSTEWSELYKYKVEFYTSGGGVTFPNSATKTGTAYIKAPSSGKITLHYRSWLRDQDTYIYRTPDDPDEPDGTATTSTKDFLLYTTLTKTVNVKLYAVSLSPSSQLKTVNVSEQAVYTFTIKNEGNIADTFSITATRGTLSKTSVSLSAGASTIFTLTDSSITPGTYTATITATSQGDTTKKAIG